MRVDTRQTQALMHSGVRGSYRAQPEQNGQVLYVYHVYSLRPTLGMS